MAGIYNKVTFDSGYERGRDIIDEGLNDYTLYRGAVMRQNVTQAPFMTAGQGTDFFGPLTGNRVTKESFLQGRGQTLSKSPDNEVTYLPESLFNQPMIQSKCDRVDLMPLFTRVKPTCNGLRETDVTAYRFSAGKFQDGYLGYNNVVYSNLQTRVGPDYMPGLYRPCAQNYASMEPTRSFARYAP